MALNRDGDRGTRNNSSVPKSGDANKTASTKFMTPPGRMSFHSLLEGEDDDQGNHKYAVTLLFPPGSDLMKMKNLLFDALDAKFGADDTKWPRGLRRPSDVIGDCEDKNYSGYEKGWKYIKFSSKDAPGIVDAERNVVIDKREIYNGRWARVSGTAFAYDNKSKGCAFGLNNVQLLQHDESFSGRPRAEDDFDDKYADDVRKANDARSGGGGRRDDRGRDTSDDDRGGRDRGRDDQGPGATRDDRGGGRDRDSRDDLGNARNRDTRDARASGGRDDRPSRDRDDRSSGDTPRRDDPPSRGRDRDQDDRWND